MKGSAAINFMQHISKMIVAGGKKRVGYAIGNIVIMALGVFFAVLVKKCLGIMTDSSFFGGLIGTIICIALTIYTFLQGFIGQFALVIIAGIGIFRSDERSGNVAAFIIALVTSVGLVIAAVYLLKTM